jgi:hypothetical protein
MLAGVPRGSILLPLYNLYTSDIPKSITFEFGIYADEQCIRQKSIQSLHIYLCSVTSKA